MKFSEIIALRRSCRTFNGLRIDAATLDRLRREIASLSPLWSDVSLPIIKIINKDNADGQLGTYGFISGARHFIVLATQPNDAAKVQGAYMLEQLVLKATEMGLSTCWIGGTFRRGPFADAIGEVDSKSEISIVVPVGHSTQKPRFFERMMRRIAKSDNRKPFADLFHGFDETTPLGRVMQGVRLAPSATNSQPWRAVATEQGSVDFSCVTSNHYSPLDMGIAYCHFLLGSAEEGLAWTIDSQTSPLALRFIPK